MLILNFAYFLCTESILIKDLFDLSHNPSHSTLGIIYEISRYLKFGYDHVF